MIYQYIDDPERGYVSLEEILEEHGLEPAACSICGGQVPEDAVNPLCRPCEGTARVAGRDLAWRERCERDLGRVS